MQTDRVNNTVHDWFCYFNEPHRSQALYNMNEIMSEVVTDSLSEAVRIGFDWASSPEHYDYWNDVYIQVLKIEEVSDYRPLIKQVNSSVNVDEIEFTPEDRVELMSLGMI